MVKTLPSNAGGTGSIPLGGTKIPQSLEPKHKTEQYCDKFKKFEGTLKMVHVQKKKLTSVMYTPSEFPETMPLGKSEGDGLSSSRQAQTWHIIEDYKSLRQKSLKSSVGLP